MLHYWYKTCPFCQQQGIVLICINEQDYRPFFSCDECLLAWHDAVHIGTQQSVFNAYDQPHHLASWQEIKHVHWEHYALHPYQKTSMTQAQYAEWKKYADTKAH